jgi:hypothetical protein
MGIIGQGMSWRELRGRREFPDCFLEDSANVVGVEAVTSAIGGQRDELLPHSLFYYTGIPRDLRKLRTVG